MTNPKPGRTAAQQRFAKFQLWVGPIWAVIGALMVGLWAWGAFDGDLSAPLASDRFLAWSKFAIGLLFVGLGIAYTIIIRRERRKSDQTPP